MKNTSTPSLTAMVTGASSGIGLAIAKALLSEGYQVYGLSRTPAPIEDENYHSLLLDLDDISLLTASLQCLRQELDESGRSIDLLINNAGCGYYGLHENIADAAVSEMVTTNLTVPMLLTGHVLRDMKERGKGTLVNISSFTANQVNPHGAAYGATKAALSSFSDSIYAEARKHGIRMILIEPELTATGLYRNADFETSDTPLSYLVPEDIACLLLTVLSNEVGYQKLTLQPQYHQIARKMNQKSTKKN